MRLLIDSLIALMLVAILAGVIFHHRQQQELMREYQTAHRELATLRETMTYHSALEHNARNEFGYPYYLSPAWFPQGLPSNRLVSGRHPWVDIAPSGDMNEQPPDPVIHSHDQAGYWYNPNLGIIRARVQEQFTEQATLSLYNQINTTMLISLPRSADPDRKPLPHPLLSSSQDDNSQSPKKQTLRDIQPESPKMTDEASPALPAFMANRTLLSPKPIDQQPPLPSSPYVSSEPVPASKTHDTLTEIHTAAAPARTTATLRGPSLLNTSAVASGD